MMKSRIRMAGVVACLAMFVMLAGGAMAQVPGGAVNVTSPKGGTMRVDNAWGTTPIEVIDAASDLQDTVPFKIEGNQIVFETVAGGKYIIRPKQGTSKAGVAEAAGKNPVIPPKWAFGVLYGCYLDQPKVLDAMARLRKDYCGDLIWVDSSWLSSLYTEPRDAPNHYINFKFDATQFPDPKAMITRLRQNHFSFGVWEWPYIEKSITDLYQYGASHKFFITNQAGEVQNGGGWHGVRFTGMIDYTNPAAAEWYKQLNQPLLDMGLNFIKIDTYATLPKGGQSVLANGRGDEDSRRAYHKTVYELTAKANGGRGFYLSHRTPSPDNLQYPGMWMGDTKTSWPGFENDMKEASKMDTPKTAAYFASDTGGYNPPDVEGDELYIRWLQYGTFLPLTEFFGNKQTKGRFPWSFGEDGQRNFKFYTKLRYELLPFRYSNAQICYHESPVKYPVRFVEGRQDEIIVGNGDSEMLVAPIHTQGATTGEAHLPAGKSWVNYWTGEIYQGGTVVNVAAPIDKVPLFVKAGSIIPMGPAMNYVDEKIADPLTLDCYPQAEGKSNYNFYEDDGKSTDYQKGAFAKTVMTMENTGGNVNVEIGKAVGDYNGKIEKRSVIVKMHGKVSNKPKVTKNGEPLAEVPNGEALDKAASGCFTDVANSLVWAKFPVTADNATKIEIVK